MSSQENIRVARRILEEGFGGGDLAVIDELVREDFVEHQHGAEGIGTEAVKRIIRGLHGSFTDMHLDIEAILADSDTVWVRSRARATNTLPFRGRPPTGRTIEIDVMDVIRFSDGRAVEHWGVADRLGMVQQVGRPGAEV